MASVPNVPIHDWTRVDAGTWHAFHHRWISAIERTLNGGVLPDGYYADPERQAPPYAPDVLALEEASHEIMRSADDDGDDDRGTAVAVAPPKLSLSRHVGESLAVYAGLRRTVAVRHERGDRLVALLELTSPANKDRPASVKAFTDKAVDTLGAGVHVSAIDLFPPRRPDGPAGLVGAVSLAAGGGELDPTPGRPLMVGAFESAPPGRLANLYAEPLAVGDVLPDLPLFYRPGRYVNVPLAATYAAAWEVTPPRWRRVIEA